MMYYKEVLKAVRQYRKDLRYFSRVCHNRIELSDADCEAAYWRGARDAYKDSASRANDLIDCYEVR